MYSLREIWKISYPIIAGLIAQNVMVVIDTAFLGRVSEVTLGAAAIGGVFYLCMVMLATGFSVGAQIMIGRRNGEANYASIGQVFDHTQIFLALLALVVWLLLNFTAPAFLRHFISSPAILAESLIFIEYRKYGLLFGFLVLGYNSLYVGNTKTKVLTLSTVIMAIVNIVMDYLLIFGNFGFPQMGIAGAALATNIAELVTFFFYLIWSLSRKDNVFYKLFHLRKPDFVLLESLLKLAVPVMFQYFFSFAAWFVFFLIIEQIGETALAASNITRSVYMVMMIPVWGLSASVNTLVSNTIGRGQHHLVMPLIYRVLFIGAIISLVLVQLIIFLPNPIASFYTDSPHLVAATLPLLRVISVALIAFSFGMILFNGLSGTGKTMLALKIEIASITLYLLTTLILALYFEAPARIVWMVEIIYFSVMGLFAWIALKKGNWRHIEI
ncbi:MAG: MATE family efflux transporter [Bacteroidota bacterium]